MVYQGELDNCADVGISLADLEEAQAPIKLSIQTSALEDWECVRKYFANIAADIIRRTFKHTTQHGVVPP